MTTFDITTKMIRIIGRLTLNLFSPYGFRETFTNARSAGEYKNRVDVSIQASGVENKVSRDNGIYVIGIPFFEHDQANAAWSDPAVVDSIFDYFIDNYDPLKCIVFGRGQRGRIRTLQGNYILGWLNYTRDPKVAGLLTRTGKAIPYRAGVLLKLGDDASVLSDPKSTPNLSKSAKCSPPPA